MFKTTMTARGQVLIPAELRRRLHLNSGTRFSIAESDGKIVLVPELPDAIGTGLGFLSGHKPELNPGSEGKWEVQRE